MFIKNILNYIDFWLRSRIRFSRGKYQGKNEDKSNLFSHLSDHEQLLAGNNEQKYLEKYSLSRLKENSTVINYLENLYIIDLLEKNLDIDSPKNSFHVLDIGSKNWSYVSGEYYFFKYRNKNLYLDGIELDAYRLYSDFYSRYDYARHYTGNLENTRYIIGNLLEHRDKYDYITWFLPFITKKPLLHWGLPLKYYKPEEMLTHAYNLLNPGGQMILVNQGESEYLIQKELLKSLNIPHRDIGIFNSVFNVYKQERFINIVQA